MIRRVRIVLPVILMLVAVAAQAQTLGGAICPDNISYSSRYLQPRGDGGLIGSDFSQLSSRQGAIAAPEYSPFLMNATSLGMGAVGTIPLRENIFLRISIINLFSPQLSSLGMAYASQGILMPVQLGIRIPFVHSALGTLGYSLYGESSAGLLFGWAYPTDGSFLNYSLPNSRFTSGASAYAGIGNTLRVDRYVGVYLNGGMGYYDLFSSSFMPQTRYLVPSVSVGFMFNFVQ